MSEADPKVTRRIVAERDPGLVATLGDLTPLRYADGGDPRQERPPHVRAASAVRSLGDRLVILQDDANVVAVRQRDGTVQAVLLPWGPGRHRLFDEEHHNKADKLDLEACAALPDGRLLAFGSGSTAERERLAILSAEPDPGGGGAAPRVALREAGDLYAALRAEAHFSGSELNLEGAVALPQALRLFQRGNGAPRGALLPVDATGDLPLRAFLAWLDGGEPLPRLERIRQYDLGAARPGRGGATEQEDTEHRGVRYGFTDAAPLGDGRVAFLAGAEDSPDATRDGDVLGCRFGILEGETAVYADIVDAGGRPTAIKLEGLTLTRQARGVLEFAVVADMDHPDTPALLGTLRVVRT